MRAEVEVMEKVEPLVTITIQLFDNQMPSVTFTPGKRAVGWGDLGKIQWYLRKGMAAYMHEQKAGSGQKKEGGK